MIQYSIKLLTLFALLVYPVLPSLCECVDAPTKDHTCCHEESHESPKKYPCPDEPHICLQNPHRGDSLVVAVTSVSFEASLDEVDTLDPYIHVVAAELDDLSRAAFSLQSESTYPDISFYLPPVRGPPASSC